MTLPSGSLNSIIMSLKSNQSVGELCKQYTYHTGQSFNVGLTEDTLLACWRKNVTTTRIYKLWKLADGGGGILIYSVVNIWHKIIWPGTKSIKLPFKLDYLVSRHAAEVSMNKNNLRNLGTCFLLEHTRTLHATTGDIRA